MAMVVEKVLSPEGKEQDSPMLPTPPNMRLKLEVRHLRSHCNLNFSRATVNKPFPP